MTRGKPEKDGRAPKAGRLFPAVARYGRRHHEEDENPRPADGEQAVRTATAARSELIVISTKTENIYSRLFQILDVRRETDMVETFHFTINITPYSTHWETSVVMPND